MLVWFLVSLMVGLVSLGALVLADAVLDVAREGITREREAIAAMVNGATTIVEVGRRPGPRH